MAIIFGENGMLTGYNAPLTIVGGAYPVADFATLPEVAAGQIYLISNFGYPQVMLQSVGAAWLQMNPFYCAWASLPSAITFDGYVGYVSNYFEKFLVTAKYNRWTPMYPLRLLNYQKAATAYGPDDPVVERTLLVNTSLPDGLLHLGDTLILDAFVERGGTLVDGGGKINVRIGTSTTPTSNPVVLSSAFAGTANTRQRVQIRGTILTATTCVQYSGTDSGFGSGTADLVTNTITNITTASQKIALTCIAGGVEETLLPYSVTVTLDSAGRL